MANKEVVIQHAAEPFKLTYVSEPDDKPAVDEWVELDIGLDTQVSDPESGHVVSILSSNTHE